MNNKPKKLGRPKKNQPNNKLEIKEPTEDTIVEEVKDNHIVTRNKITSKKYWSEHFKRKNFQRSLIVNMQYTNGNFRTFYVKTSGSSFKINKALYVIDEEALYYNITYKEYCLDYHERFPLPLKREVRLSELTSVLRNVNSEIELSFDPLLLEKFLKSEIAQGIMKGKQIDDFLRQVRLIVIIGALAGLLTLMLMINESGMLKNLKIFG